MSKKKTQYPITNGSKIYYRDNKGEKKIGYAKKMGVLPGGKVSFLIQPHRNSVETLGGEWIGEEQIR